MVDRPRALTRTVIIDGEVFGPGDVPPPHIALRIRNPQCWETLEDSLAQVGTPVREPAVTPVPTAEPAPNGLRNLDPQSAGTVSSAVPPAAPGTIGGRPEPEEPVDQAVFEPEQPEQSGPDPLPEPPRSGKGASTMAWKAYAQWLGVEVPVGADRNQIITMLRDSGHIQ